MNDFKTASFLVVVYLDGVGHFVGEQEILRAKYGLMNAPGVKSVSYIEPEIPLNNKEEGI